MTHMFARALSCLILAGCAPLATPPGPPPAPAATDTPYYLEYSFGALPGWERAALEPSLRAFLRGCERVEPLTCDARCAEDARDEFRECLRSGDREPRPWLDRRRVSRRRMLQR